MGVAAIVAVATDRAGGAVLWMLAALAVDSVDGSLARSVGVVRVTPNVDGRRLDDIVDYQNFVVVPLAFLLLSGGLPQSALGWAAASAALVASGFGFAHRHAKTPDHFFRGFPSYWNVVAIYIWLLQLDATLCAWIVLALAACVGVPFRFLHPSRAPMLRRTTVGLGVVWCLGLGVATAWVEAPWSRTLVLASLGYPALYLALSAWLGGFRD
jgi:phosphatidylcholine synthase